jgi:hypothetical protein
LRIGRDGKRHGSEHAVGGENLVERRVEAFLDRRGVEGVAIVATAGRRHASHHRRVIQGLARFLVVGVDRERLHVLDFVQEA